MAQPEKKDHFVTGVIAENRRARYDFVIGETYEAGLELRGDEVKSLRLGHATVGPAFIYPNRGELFVHQLKIEPYDKAREGSDPVRLRRLLMHKSEIKKISAALLVRGASCIVLKMYFNNKGRVKILIALATGKNTVDKRQTIKKRELDIEAKSRLKNG